MDDGAELARDPECRSIPELVSFLIMNVAFGSAIGFGLALGILAIDLGHLRSLILASDDPGPPVFLLFLGFGTTFGSIYAASAAMLSHRDAA